MKYPSTKRLSSLKDPSPWFDWKHWHFTEKLDGTCVQIRITKDGDSFRYAIFSRNGNNQPPGCIQKAINSKIVLPIDTLRELNKEEIIVFGEGFGQGVQGQIGQEYGKSQFAAFAIQADGVWWNPSGEEWFVKELGLDFVRRVENGWPRPLWGAVFEITNGQIKSHYNPSKLVEGIIARPTQTLLWPDGSRVLFKLKSEEYYKGNPQDVMDLNFRRTKKDNRS